MNDADQKEGEKLDYLLGTTVVAFVHLYHSHQQCKTCATVAFWCRRLGVALTSYSTRPDLQMYSMG